jgi:dolichyl-phosphate-mannose-protein mannosyltransferase
MSGREKAAAIAATVGWFLLAYLVVAPLANAPVVDSWLYAHAVGLFRARGRVQFAGFTQAQPVAQVIYGAAWSMLFGASASSLDLSVAALGALGGVILYALLRRCGASIAAAAIATGLLVANPCYLFLSFSFMTEVPFLSLLLAAYLAFASAEGSSENRRLWLSAALVVGAFLVRPFAAAAIVGFTGALLMYDLRPSRVDLGWLKRAAPKLAPFAAAMVACAMVWFWLTVLKPAPWELRLTEHRIRYVLDVSPAGYLRAGVIAPLLYLGLVLAPLALVQLPAAGWRRAAALSSAIFAAAWILLRLDPGPPAIPELSCYGGWSNRLDLKAMSGFAWHGEWQLFALAFASIGSAGLIVAAPKAFENLNRAGAAVTLSAACYWAATLPLWFFNDRYYLVLVPSGCLLLALVPLPRGRLSTAAAAAMAAMMGYASLAGVYDYHRGLSAVVAERDALEAAGVPRSAIDAGYSLNGADLYRYVDNGEESYSDEQGIPMITSKDLEEYTIAAAPIAGTLIVRRFPWPGPLGFGSRELYVLRRIRPQPPNAAASAR